MEIYLTKHKRPVSNDPEELIDYILSTLNLKQGIYRTLIKEIIHNKVRAGSIRGVKRTTAIYHLNRMVRMGILIKKGSYYELREKTLHTTLEEVKKDVIRVLDDLIDVAKKLDNMLKEVDKDG